jgi:DNA recombination protein RmuC
MNSSLFLILFCSASFLYILVMIIIINRSGNSKMLEKHLTDFFTRFEREMRQEFSGNREEFSRNQKELRNEIMGQFHVFSELITSNIKEIGNLQKNQLETFGTQLKSNQEYTVGSDVKNREELNKSLLSFEEKFSNNIKDFNELLKQKMDSIVLVQNEMSKTIELRLEKMRETLEIRVKQLQDENSKKLEEMRVTVDEKLHSTLEKRLSESFNQVSERLELVHKGLGEMQNLATGVGDLKKVLSNVKTRGIFGEIQLGNILEQILSKEQYETNVMTKPGSRENVEYAIKLPGKDDLGKEVYLPIDSKFPMEDYHALLDAYDTGDPSVILAATKSLENTIKKVAKSIRDKYIEIPHTTDFGIMFLPVEGLYAEVVRRTNLLEILQREYKIVVTGPTTLAAILNSLQMGFKTLAIEKRSSEVWKILSAVKTEFAKFGDVLKKAQEKIIKASEDIDNLVGTRTRQIQSKLRSVENLSISESTLLLSDSPETDLNDDIQ